MADVSFESTPSGNQLRIEEKPLGPLIVINQDGTVSVTRGPFDEAGRLFWESVKINGATYREKIAALRAENAALAKTNALLQEDPWKDALSNGLNVWQAIPKAARKSLTKGDVYAVLEAVTRLAMRKMQ
jgi:hypothetical protein